MKDITKNEMEFMLHILKNPKIDFNANSMAKQLGISRMGSLKIAKRLESERILSSKELGKANFLKLNADDDYAKDYAIFLLKREARNALPYVRVWIKDLQNIQNACAIMIFGSVLRKGRNANDVDVLFVLKENQLQKLRKEIDEINKRRSKHIHPMFQTIQDIKNNIEKEDPPLLNALRGVVVKGEDIFVESMIK